MNTRLTAVRLGRLAGLLGERDLAIVATLRNLRLATGAQLRELHFAGIPVADRQARRALARLVELRVLSRLGRTIGGQKAGSAGYVYALDVAGQRLAKGTGPAGGYRVERPWTPSSVFLRHVLAGTELLVRLTAAERADRLELLAFDGEPSCWRRFYGPSGRVESLKPDAFVRVGLGEFEDSYFVENDFSTESPATIDRKLSRYRSYAASGMEQRRCGVFPRVLWLVPDQARRAVVVDACARQPADSWPLYRVATYDQAVSLIARGMES